MDKQMQKRRVLVTGASGALGQAVSARFLKAGFEVTGTSFELPSQHKHPGSDQMRWIPVDLTNSEQVKAAFKDESFEVVVHCAGGFRFSEIDKLSDADFDFLMKTNLFSAFYLIRELVPNLKKNRFGRIVFISSAATLQAQAGMSAYSASKAGLNQLTSTLATELKAYNITVNSLLPSIIDTPANRRDMPKADFSKWVTTDHLAEICHFIVSEAGSSITGALIPVAGRV